MQQEFAICVPFVVGLVQNVHDFLVHSLNIVSTFHLYGNTLSTSLASSSKFVIWLSVLILSQIESLDSRCSNVS